MSLARTALRLAAVEALRADPIIAALCGGRVYDSRVADLDAKEPLPAIVVDTGDSQGDAFDAQNGGEPFDEACDLAIEIAMEAVAVDEQGEAFVVAAPGTDRELAATLDLLTHRAAEVLTVGESSQARLLRKVVRRCTRKRIEPFKSDETGDKLRIHLVTLTAQLFGEGQGDATVLPGGAYASLPQPLRAVCEAMPAGSSGEAVCLSLTNALSVPTLNKFAGADLTLQPVPELAPAGPPLREAEPGGSPEIRDDTHTITW